MAKLMRVLYDFKAEEEGELSVRAGQLVQPKEDASASDGWTLVQVSGQQDVFGYVPSDYLAQVSQTAVSPAPTQPNINVGSPVGRGAASVSGEPSFATSRFSSAASPARGFNTSIATLNAAALSSSALGGNGNFGSATSNAGLNGTNGPAAVASVEAEFAQLFASHEEWFRAASAKRADTYKSLLAESSDVLRSVQESLSRSNSALERVQGLERLIADEKGKWSKQALDISSSGVAY